MKDDEYVSKKTLFVAMCFNNVYPQDMSQLEFVNKLPNADVQEVKHGSFIRYEDWDGYDYFKCTACRGTFYIVDGSSFCDYDYCPRCGAKMDGGNR